jgi:hypothetical protein
MIYIIFIIIILILFINYKENFDNFNYVGPIQFLQKTTNANDRCLGNISYKCIGTYPEGDDYPDETEMKYVNDITIIKIPKGYRGTQGISGYRGRDLENKYNPEANLSKISSSSSDNSLAFRVNRINPINIKTPKINIPNNAKICLNNDNENNCLDKDDIKKIIGIIYR